MPETSPDRLNLAIALYQAKREIGDPAFNELEASEQDAWVEDARAAERRCDPVCRAVAVERAAEAFADAQGWSWPDLKGYTTTAADPELAKIEARQKMRYFAKVACQAYDDHLSKGGVEGHPELEDNCARDIRAQREDDAARRRTLKPIPPATLRLIDSMKGGL